MASIKTLNQFQNALDKEMAWRVKEIHIFRSASKQNDLGRKSFIRAGMALVYAHWEGFVKSSSEIYLEYVKSRNLTYRQLKSCFVVFGLKKRLGLLSESRKSASNIEAFDFILEEMDKVADLVLKHAINTESNLTSKVFCNIALSLGIDISTYDTRFNFIDESLVRRRNSIAHGEYIDLSGEEFSSVIEDVLLLMRHYKTDIENAASLETFKRTPELSEEIRT